MRTLVQARSQRIAAISYQCVTARCDNGPLHLNKEERADYLSTARSLPALVRKAGLTQALAFVHSREGDGYAALLVDLVAVLEADKADEKTDREADRKTDRKADKPNALLATSRSAPLGQYMRLTRRALTALDWLKRYAETELVETELAERDGKQKTQPAATSPLEGGVA